MEPRLNKQIITWRAISARPYLRGYEQHPRDTVVGFPQPRRRRFRLPPKM